MEGGPTISGVGVQCGKIMLHECLRGGGGGGGAIVRFIWDANSSNLRLLLLLLLPLVLSVGIRIAVLFASGHWAIGRFLGNGMGASPAHCWRQWLAVDGSVVSCTGLHL